MVREDQVAAGVPLDPRRPGAGLHAAAALCGPRLLRPHRGGTLAARLKARALEEGFSACGICAPDAIPEAAGRLAAFVAAGWHGRMGWMAERMGWRGSPAALWPEARSVVMLAEVYTPEEDPLAVLARRDRGAISVYARGRDYHDIVKRRLKRLGRWLVAETGAEIKVFVDTAPVMEKPLAQAAGLGWQGKHTNLVSRELGSWFFLGAIFTTLELPRDARGRRPLRLVPGLPRRLPDAGVSRALPARCAALHQLSDDRARRAGRRGAAAAHGQPDLRLRRLPRGLPVEQVRRRGAGGRLPGAGGARRARAGAARRPRRRRRSAPASAARRSSGSGGTASCATCSTPSATRGDPRGWRPAGRAAGLADDADPGGAGRGARGRGALGAGRVPGRGGAPPVAEHRARR